MRARAYVCVLNVTDFRDYRALCVFNRCCLVCTGDAIPVIISSDYSIHARWKKKKINNTLRISTIAFNRACKLRDKWSWLKNKKGSIKNIHTNIDINIDWIGVIIWFWISFLNFFEEIFYFELKLNLKKEGEEEEKDWNVCSTVDGMDTFLFLFYNSILLILFFSCKYRCVL